jgi:hypothetical protein
LVHHLNHWKGNVKCMPHNTISEYLLMNQVLERSRELSTSLSPERPLDWITFHLNYSRSALLPSSNCFIHFWKHVGIMNMYQRNGTTGSSPTYRRKVIYVYVTIG